MNPDQTTYDYVNGREYAPKGADFDEAVGYWDSIKSDPDAEYDDVVKLHTDDLSPMVTWGITPGQSIGIHDMLPTNTDDPLIKSALEHMQFEPGKAIKETEIDVVFLGSCTNSRLSDLRAAASLLKGKRVHDRVEMIVVPGSQQVKKAAEEEGLDQIFMAAGAQWRDAGCSMCLGMNPDKLKGDQLCASTSNRNFIGRQGSPTGRTLLMSPEMVAVAAVEGKVVDVREYL